MAFQTSNDVFEAVFGQEPELSPAEGYIEEISSYLKTRIDVPGAVVLGEWMADGRPLSTFTCREDLAEALAENLREQKIPYAVLFSEKGQTGFIIRECDGEKADEVKAVTLLDASRVCRVVSGRDMLDYAAASRAKDKSCLALHGLTQAQAFYIKAAYARYYSYPEIGLDEMADGTYTLTIQSQNSVKKNAREGNVDICTILLEAAMKTYGPNGGRNTFYAEMEDDYRYRLAKGFQEEGVNLNRTPLWIIGKGTQYMKITAQGFVYGHAKADEESVTLIPEVEVADVQPDYRQQLMSYSIRIPYKVFTYSSEAVIFHFQNKTDESEIDTADISPEPMYYVYKRGENQLVKTIDRIMTRKLHNEEIMIMDGRWHEKIARYLTEAQDVLKALAIGRLPSGYEPEDLSEIHGILEKHKMQAEMYEQSIQALQDIQTVPIIETVERIADVQKKLGQTRAEMDLAKKKEREERAAKRGHGKTPVGPGTASHGSEEKDKEDIDR